MKLRLARRRSRRLSTPAAAATVVAPRQTGGNMRTLLRRLFHRDATIVERINRYTMRPWYAGVGTMPNVTCHGARAWMSGLYAAAGITREPARWTHAAWDGYPALPARR